MSLHCHPTESGRVINIIEKIGSKSNELGIGYYLDVWVISSILAMCFL